MRAALGCPEKNIALQIAVQPLGKRALLAVWSIKRLQAVSAACQPRKLFRRNFIQTHQKTPSGGNDALAVFHHLFVPDKKRFLQGWLFLYFLEQIIPLLQNPIILLQIVIIDPAQLAKLHIQKAAALRRSILYQR